MSEVKSAIKQMAVYYLLLAINFIPWANIIADTNAEIAASGIGLEPSCTGLISILPVPSSSLITLGWIIVRSFADEGAESALHMGN